MGFVAICVMTATFFISKNDDSPETLIILESIIAIFILSIGNSVIRLVEQIYKLNKMKSEFISVASHQLRTPISAIKWETELILTKFKKGLSQKQLKNIETIDSLSSRMIRLVSDLLDVARIDQKRLVLKNELFDVTEVVNAVITELSPLARAKSINIKLNYGKKLPMITGDAEKIKMVIENLLSNSIKYISQRGKIEVKIIKKGGRIILSVKDNGVGIPRSQQNRIFERFFRSDNAVKYQTDGTGLGLYIAKNIIEQSGGRIWFQSVEGLGSIFSFSLPIK